MHREQLAELASYMSALPVRYADLAKEGAPKMLVEALKLYGVLEVPGSGDSATIMGWAKELGIRSIYTADSIPWCGLFAAIVAKRAGKEVVKDPLWALNWGTFGKLTKTPELGDILTFKREGGGHVALYVGEDDTAYHCLGGNQSDSVCITRIAKSRLYQARTPEWQVAKPANVRRILRTSNGKLSTNEA